MPALGIAASTTGPRMATLTLCSNLGLIDSADRPSASWLRVLDRSHLDYLGND
jgi:hypothetical protein